MYNYFMLIGSFISLEPLGDADKEWYFLTMKVKENFGNGESVYKIQVREPIVSLIKETLDKDTNFIAVKGRLNSISGNVTLIAERVICTQTQSSL